MPNLNDYAKNAARFGGIDFAPKPNETRTAQGQRKPYFTRQTQAYGEEIGEVADNCYDAEMQGVNPDVEWHEFTPVLIRTVAAAQARTGVVIPDDWQLIHLLKPAGYTYTSPGAYLRYGGNTWIVDKSYNFSVGIGNCVVRRCNAVINTRNWYGKVMSVPISYSTIKTLSNAPQISENTIISKNYIDCVCQVNRDSANFTENTRLILGGTAYAMRGVNNFTREFTDDPDSVHLMTFTISRVETLKTDNLDLQCADYYGFSWVMNLSVRTGMRTGETQTINVTDTRNGIDVVTSAEHPITHGFESDNPAIATVDQTGKITAIKPGKAVISVKLDQNPEIVQAVELTVADAGEPYIAFSSVPAPLTIREFTDEIISAVYYENGRATDKPVTFAFAGASTNCYTAEIKDGNSVLVTCYTASPVPLTVTASYGELTASQTINLITT